MANGGLIGPVKVVCTSTTSTTSFTSSGTFTKKNCSSTIEALVNGKHVMVPFFEKKRMLKKYLYKFNKEIIYTSEKNMEKKILKLMNKYATFPLKNQKHRKTIEYYLGNTKNISQKYLNFLSK